MHETKTNNRIIVIGVGDAGCHAINRMIDEEMEGVEFIGMNTNKQSLQSCKAPKLLQIGTKLTGGQDAGARPEIGERAANESAEEIVAVLKGADMVFVVCGMGGGTGTGAAPVVAKLAKNMGILTVGVVTLPFSFEKRACMSRAQEGIECIREFADTLIVFPGDNLIHGKSRNTTQLFAFRKMNKVLQQTVQRILNAFHENDVIGFDFTHIEWIMKPRGMAQVGLGEGQGNEKALNAVQRAAKGLRLDTALTENMRIIIHVSGDVDLKDANYAIDYVRKLAGEKVNIAFGARYDNSIADHCVVTVIVKVLEDAE